MNRRGGIRDRLVARVEIDGCPVNRGQCSLVSEPEEHDGHNQGEAEEAGPSGPGGTGETHSADEASRAVPRIL